MESVAENAMRSDIRYMISEGRDLDSDAVIAIGKMTVGPGGAKGVVHRALRAMARMDAISRATKVRLTRDDND